MSLFNLLKSQLVTKTIKALTKLKKKMFSPGIVLARVKRVVSLAT